MAKRTSNRRSSESQRVNSYKLFYRRHSSGLTLTALGNLTGISASRLQQLENVRLPEADSATELSAFPTIDKKELSSVSKVLNVSAASLLAGKLDDFSTETIAYYNTYSSGSTAPRGSSSLPINWKAKAIVFDFDGTLTRPGTGSTRTTWEQVWQTAGYNVNDCGLLATRFFSKEITHSQWCQLTLEKLKDKNLTYDAVVDAAKGIELVDGFEECIKELEKREIPLFIVSGAIWDILSEVLGQFVGSFRRIESNVFGYDHKANLATITGTKYDFEGKRDFVEEIASDLGIETSEVLFVGNSINDVHVKKCGARTLLINPHFTNPGDGDAWDHYIPRLNSLVEILPFADASWKREQVENQKTRNELIFAAVDGLGALRIQDLAVLGNYIRYSESDRSLLVGLADKIRRPLVEKSETRENFLIYALPGSGKTFFINELARDFQKNNDLEFIEIDLSRDDKSTCEGKLKLLEDTNKPCLCMIDEIDGRKGEDWPYDLFYKKMDLNESSNGKFVFVLIGSSGGSLRGLGDNIRARPKGKDLVDRILQSGQHCATIPSMGIEDSAVVFATKVLEAADRAIPVKNITEIGKAAVLYALHTCTTPRQFKLLADQAVRRVSPGHSQLLFDHLFEAADREIKDIFVSEHEEYLHGLGNITFRITM